MVESVYIYQPNSWMYLVNSTHDFAWNGYLIMDTLFTQLLVPNVFTQLDTWLKTVLTFNLQEYSSSFN